jgi:hypothetical protein
MTENAICAQTLHYARFDEWNALIIHPVHTHKSKAESFLIQVLPDMMRTIMYVW